MKRVVIESPLSGSVERNLYYARLCLRDCLLRGESPYASHVLLVHPDVLDDQKPEERRLGMDAGFAWQPRADLVAVYYDLGISKGMREGIGHAVTNRIPWEQRGLPEDLLRRFRARYPVQQPAPVSAPEPAQHCADCGALLLLPTCLLCGGRAAAD